MSYVLFTLGLHDMDILTGIKAKNNIPLLKILKSFAEAQIIAQKQFSYIRQNEPDIVLKLTPKILFGHQPSKLTATQKQFYDFYKKRKEVAEVLYRMSYPVLDHGFIMPIRPIHETVEISNEYKLKGPYLTFMSPHNNGVFVLTTADFLSTAKSTVFELSDITPDDIQDIPVDSSIMLFAGMTNPKEAAALISSIDEYLENALDLNNESDDDFVFSC